MGDKTSCKGEKTDPIPVLRKKEYGTGETDKYGRPVINWNLLDNADENGFYTKHKEANNHHKMKVTLPKGTRIIRYGSEIGHHTAPKGTEYEELSLPYVKESLVFREYEVIADSIEVEGCVVDRGVAAPGFGCKGFGVQYYHYRNMIYSVNKKLLREVKENECM